MAVDKKKIILVEGEDELYFFIHLLEYKKISDIFVESFKGKDKLTTHIETLIKRDGFDDVTSIIIFRDSDDSSKSASDSINYSLRKNDLITTNIEPFKMNEHNNKKIGFGLFPGVDENGVLINTGTLEHLCLNLFRDNTNNTIIKNYLDDFQEKNGKFKCLHKNELHALFSFTDKYVGSKIGETAKFGGFDFDSPHLLPFIEMINKME